MPLESNEHEYNPSKAGRRESREEGGEAPPQMPPTVPPPNPPQPPPVNPPPNKEPSKWRENTKLGLEIGGLAILIAYTVFSALQWLQIRWTNQLTREALNGSNTSLQQTLGKMQGQINEMHTLAMNAGTQATQTTDLAGDTKDLAQTSKDALVSVQRAFVFATGLDAIRIGDPNDPTKVDSLEFSITWENNGTTPTRDMTTHYNWLTPQNPLPDNFPYPDLGDTKASPIALGPKTVGHTTPIQIPAAIISKIVNHEGYLYIWGWARYRDIFSKTKPHITRFCAEVTGFQGNPLDGNPGTLSRPILINCASNCYDDECKVK